ncbi:hypothetical protein ROJ8625_03341 [Roseivivax jejudonensis]|uniref:Formate dehydrogenase region TAT target n=1 Tax=Roseivivax jejudonensis TaxID=1529041 RepID=A0A1X6ZYG2_9RHOB|nr:hypothetical protein [Roseivivax jejudonensis]SLN65372.1 hypothetical protein ROJ8625_03341 [Roseivivax jejudonensis]
MSSDAPSRRSVLSGLAVLPATVAPAVAAAHETKPDALRPDGRPRHDPVMRDTDHVRTYYALART